MPQPKFNKYSGVVEFRNAVLLFINVNGSNYTNTFDTPEKGPGAGEMQVTWFAQPTMHEGTPVVKRLTAQGARNPTFLFCRAVPERGPTQPYCACGQLALVDVDAARKGAIRFRFTLSAFEVLKTRRPFRDLLFDCEGSE